MTNIITLHHHYLPVRTIPVTHHYHTNVVEATQSGACDEQLFWIIVVILIGVVIYTVIDLWRK